MTLRLVNDACRPASSIEVQGDQITVYNPPRRHAPGALLDEADPEALAALLNGHPRASQLMTACVRDAALVAVERPQATMVSLTISLGAPHR